MNSNENIMIEEDELNLLDYWQVIWKQKVLIILVVLIASVITLVKDLKMNPIYEATAAVLPPETESSSGGGSLAALSKGLASNFLPNLLAGNSNTNTVIAMLKSRRMAEDIIDKFELKKQWKEQYQIDTVTRVQAGTKISISSENVISITVESADKKLVADIANFYVANLNKMNEELELSSSKPVVRVLDMAQPAEKKSKPAIKKDVLLAGMGALLIGIMLAFLREGIARQKAKENGQ